MKQELCDHIWQVGIEAEEYRLCDSIMRVMEEENQKILNPKHRMTVPDEIRSLLTN